MNFTPSTRSAHASIRLGRDKDPRIPSDIGLLGLSIRKLQWSLVGLLGLRFMIRLIYPRTTVSHLDVDGAVAFPIDDGFCGVDNPNGCMLEEVRVLFKEHDAQATFFITGTHCSHTSDVHVKALLDDGHELLNHNMLDRPYHRETAEEFETDFLATDDVLSQYRSTFPPWYRAPFGRLSRAMQSVLEKHGRRHILCDCFANDTAIPDPEWIARFILRRVKAGSIVLIHMPERGCREWNLQAMRLTLAGLSERRLRVVNFSELQKITGTTEPSV